MRVTNTVKNERIKRGLTRKYLAKKIGVHQQTLYQIEENTINSPGLKIALMLSEYFDMKVEDLFKIEI